MRIYFLILAVNITLIVILLTTLLHLAGNIYSFVCFNLSLIIPIIQYVIKSHSILIVSHRKLEFDRQ